MLRRLSRAEPSAGVRDSNKGFDDDRPANDDRTVGAANERQFTHRPCHQIIPSVVQTVCRPTAPDRPINVGSRMEMEAATAGGAVPDSGDSVRHVQRFLSGMRPFGEVRPGRLPPSAPECAAGISETRSAVTGS